MSRRRLALLGVAVGAIALWLVPVSGQAPAGSLKTAWGAPDLSGIWEDQIVTPFERPKAGRPHPGEDARGGEANQGIPRLPAGALASHRHLQAKDHGLPRRAVRRNALTATQ